ncbi:MAG: hypothetical protein ACK44O_18255 [Novosphingobium sp.]|uniref:hypothetical protein n=1 Tax=Novosphingobium sp. TaxID=1874826 RepID=UPI00391A6E4F
MKGVLAALALTASTLASAETPAPVPYPDLAGEWLVDLRIALTDPAYGKDMVLKIAADRSITGIFYDSEILAGRAGSAQGRQCVAFRTTDGQGMYHSSACLTDGRMVGQTWAEGRNFVLPWTATRK